MFTRGFEQLKVRESCQVRIEHLPVEVYSWYLDYNIKLSKIHLKKSNKFV